MLDAYFNYLRQVNLAFSDVGLSNALHRISGDVNFKKSVLTNPNLPLQNDNIYRPAEYNGTVYLVNTRNSADSKKISDQSGKLVKANKFLSTLLSSL